MLWFERRIDCNIKRLHSDDGGEYVALSGFLNKRGIENSFSPPYSPNQNAISERANRTIVEATRAILQFSKLPRSFWAEAMRFSAHIRNRFLAPRQDTCTSYELLYGHKPRTDHIRVFGCLCWVHIPKEKRNKLDNKTEKGILLYCFDNSQYKVWIKSTQTVVVTPIIFEESIFPGVEWFENRIEEHDVPQKDTVTPHDNQNFKRLGNKELFEHGYGKQCRFRRN